MSFSAIRKVCRPTRIVLGLSLIAYGVIMASPIFFLGAIPLIAGITNFCPLCSITNKCDI